MAKQLNVDVNLNTAQAEAKLKNLQNLLSQAITSSSKSSAGGLTQEIVQATKAASELKVMLGQAMNPNTGNLDLSRFSQQLSKSKTSLNDYAKSLTKLGPQGQQAFMSLSKSIVSAEVPMRDTSKMLNEFGTTLKNTMRWQATSSLIHNLVGGIQSAMSYARGLNSSLNSIRIVTGLSADEMNKFAKSANESAKALSASTLDYTDAALIYYQQGIRDQKQIKDRTDATIKMANVTGDSAAKVSNQLTAIWNNFAKGGDNLEYYADVITALGAATASSSAEISAGLEKFASIAEETGLSYEYATSSLATIVATTRQSADVVGTALKTIFGRIQSLNLGETLEDGTTLGKYSKALSQVGIDIKDQNGQLKDMDNILDEMGAKWQGLNRDQRVALAQSVAGARQYNQLMALMENYDFFKENVAIAKGSEGELTKQAEIYAESWDAAKTRVRAAAQGIFDDLISDKFFIGFNDGLATALGGIDKFVDALGGIPGTLGLIGSIVTKVFSSQIGQSIERGIQSFKVFTGVARVEANSVREQAITAAKTFTPDETAPKSLQMQSSSLQQQLVLANQYQQKMEAIAKAGGQVAASDKQRIASLMQIVELTQEAAIAAQQQVEASEMAQNQMNANILRNTIANEIKKGASIKDAREAAASRMKDVGKSQQQLEAGYLAQSGLARLKDNNLNLTKSQLEGLIRIILNRQSMDNTERLQAKRQQEDGLASMFSDKIKGRIDALNLLRSGQYQKTNESYQSLQKKLRNFKGSDADKAKLEAEATKLEVALKSMATKIQKAVADSANKIKDANFDIEQAESAIIQDLINESESTRNKVLEDVQKKAESKVNAEDLENQGKAYLDETADTIENLNKESFSGLTQGLTTAMSGVANLAMGFSSLKSGIEAINDESLSFGDKLMQVGMSFGMAVPMITSGLNSMITGIPGFTKGASGLVKSALLSGDGKIAKKFTSDIARQGYREALAAGEGSAFLASMSFRGMKDPGGAFLAEEGRKALKSGKTLQEARGAAALAYQQKFGKYATATQVSSMIPAQGGPQPIPGGLSAMQIAGIVAALAALAVIIAKVKKEIHEASLEGQLEKAVEEGNSLSSALDEAKSSAEGLKSAFDSYHGIADSLSKCTTGTQEWTEALRANNNEVISLMSQYPELAKIQGAIQKNADGSLSISQETEEQMNKMAQDRVDTLSWAKLANTELQQSLQDQMDLKTRSREMMNMQIAGQDIGHYEQGMEYKKDIKTSDFDTDMIGGFSYIHGNDSTGADAYERNQSRESQGPGQLTEVSANQKANELLLENWGELQSLSGESLTQALSKVMTEGGLKIAGDDLVKYSAGVESAAYRAEMTKMYNQQKAQQEAFETQQIGLINNKLASEGILDNDSKTRDLLSNIFGKQLDERTKEAVAADKEAYNHGGEERKALAEEYVRAMGGDINSISWQGNEFSYLDSAGQKIEGVTGAMVASVTGAASALDQLAGSAEAAAGAMREIPMTQDGDAIRDFLQNEDFSKTSASDLRELLKHSVDEAGELVGPDALAKDLINAMGGAENATKIAEVLGTTLPDLIGTMTADLINQNDWLNSTERAASIKAFKNKGVDEERLENYSRAELEARQSYEDSKYKGPVKSLSELQTMAEAAGEAQQYLNRAWEDGTRLSAEQAAGIKDVIQNQDLYNMAIDENTGKIKDAQLLQELLGDTVQGVGTEALRSQIPLYEQLNTLYDQLNENASKSDDPNFNKRQESILSEIELLEQEIATYQKLALVQSGALQAYDRIAKGKEYDEANDYTDELEGALGSIYSHMEKDSKGRYKWDTLQRGSHEVQAAMEALLPEDILTGTNREGITAQQYLRDMYGDGNVGGRYRDKDGNITKANVDNFVNDMLGKKSSWGQYSGFLEGREGYTAQQLYENGFADFLEVGEQGAVKQQGTIAEAAKSMHMTESSFISMLSAADKYNTSGISYFSAFTAEGSDLATQLQFQAEAIKSSAEQVSNAKKELDEVKESGTDEQKTAAQKKYNDALAEQAAQIKAQREQQEKAMEGAAKYKALQNQLDTAESETEISSILEKMQQLKDEYGEGIEINVSLVTDESIITNLKNQIDEQFGEGGLESYIKTGENGKEVGYANQNKFWDNIAQQLAGADNIGQALQDTFGSALDGVDYSKLPNAMKRAFEKNGLEDTVKSYLEEGLESVEVDDSILGEDSIKADELVQGARDAAQEAVDAAQEVADANPIELSYGSKEGEEGPEKTVSDYTGSESNDPRKDGFTTGNKGRKGAVQSGGSNPKITVELDTTQAQANLDAFTASIASIPATIPLSISGNITDVSDHIATLSGLLATLGGNVPALTITTNSTTIDTQLDNTKTKAEALSSIKPKIMIQCNANSINRSVSNLASNLRSLKSPPPIHISITADPVPSIPGINGAYGTARAYGNAFENGKWGTGMGPTPALVGELGQELVVDPATGRFYTVGDTGAEFVKLPKNAIVFNHRQTEGLLKNRKINSRGQAMAEGNTDQVKGLAFAAGTDETVQYQEKMLTIIRNEVDLFKEIEYQLNKINHELKSVQRNIGRLAGRDAFENIEKTIQKLNELYKENLHARDYAIENNKLDKQALNSVLIQWEQQKEHSSSKAGERKYNTERAEQIQDAFKFLETYGKLSSDAYKRDANGVVTEYDKYAVEHALKEMTRNAEITYNGAVKSETLTQQQQVAAENAYNYIMAGVEAIGKAFSNEQDTAEKVWEYTENAQDNLEEMHDLEMQRIKEEFELRKQLANNDIKRIELIMKRLDNNFFKRAEKLSFMFDKDHMFEPTNWAKNGTHTELGDRIKLYHAAIKQFEDAKADLEKAQAERGYADPHAITEQAFMDLSQSSIDELADFEEYLIDLIDTMRTYFADTLEQASGELEKYTDQMGHYVSVLDHMSNLMDLLGRKFDFDSKESIIRGQMNGLNNDLKVRTQMFEELDKNREEAEKHLAEHAAEYSKEAYEYEYNNLVLPSIQAAQEAEEKKYEAAEAYLEKLEALYQNAFDRINAEWEKLGTQGQGWDYLTGAMERAKAIQDEYLTTTNKLYETNTLMRKVQNDINKTDSSVSKEKLMNFNKEIEAAQQNDKLAKSSMEILKARYELLQAEMALEDAKNAKSTVRLQRDNEGNYGYVYTADQDDINDKEQDFADKQNDLYNLVWGYQNDYQEKSMQAMQEFQTKWMELEQQRKDGLIASDTELYAKQEELKAQYQEIFDAYNISMTESEQWLNEIAAEGVSEAWAKSWEDRRGNLTDFMGFSNDAHTKLNGYLKEMNDVRNEVVKDAKLGMDDVNKKVQELTTKSNTLKTTITETVIPAIGEEISAVRDLTEAFDEQYDHLGDLIDQVHNYLNAMSQAQVDLVGKEYQDDIYDQDFSSLDLQARLAGDHSGSNLITRDQKIDLYNMKGSVQDSKNVGAINEYLSIHAAENDEAFIQKAASTLYRITKEDSVDFASLSDKEKDQYVFKNIANKKTSRMDTGGYTGEWGSEGKIAILHEKELVLNKDDTSKFLYALEIAKENYSHMTQMQQLQSLYQQQMQAAINDINTTAYNNNNGTLQQDVTIHAEFPNVTERNEIAEAFKTLVNEASQFANRY